MVHTNLFKTEIKTKPNTNQVEQLINEALFEKGDFVKAFGKTYKIILVNVNNKKTKYIKEAIVYRCKEYVMENGVMTSVMSSPKKPYISIINESKIIGKFIYNQKFGFWEYTKR